MSCRLGIWGTVKECVFSVALHFEILHSDPGKNRNKITNNRTNVNNIANMSQVTNGYWRQWWG